MLQFIIDLEKIYVDKQKDESNKEEEETKRAENLRKRAMDGMNTNGDGKSAKRSKDERHAFLMAKMEREFEYKEIESDLRR